MFTKEQEILLETAKDKFSNSTLWPWREELKLAALVDVYAGFYPDIQQRDEKLILEYSKKLIKYCEDKQRLFPDTKEDNEILRAYHKSQSHHGNKEDGKSTSFKKHKSKHQREHKKNIFQMQEEKYNIEHAEEKKDKLLDDNYLITRNNIAFLIEGSQTRVIYTEVRGAIHLAKTNGCPYFDIILSYDKIHLAEALKNADEKKQKTIVLSTFLSFYREVDPQIIIDKMIKLPFENLIEQNIINCIPEWVSNLNSFTINSFCQSVLNEYFNGDPDRFASENNHICQKLVHLSNKLSFEQLTQYLLKHPEVNIVYGLVGSLHLPMLNRESKISTKDYCYSQLSIEDKLVDVHLFGGAHGEISHYTNMANAIRKTNLIVPDLTTIPEQEIDKETYQMVIASGADSIYDYSKSDETNNENYHKERNSKRSRGNNIEFFSTQSSPSESTALIENSEKETACCFPCNLV